MPTVIAATTDLVLIILFAVIGRRSHDQGSALSGTLTVAAPFLIGYAIAAAFCRLDRAPRSARRGMLIAPVAVGLGLVLRGTVFGRGVAPAFVVVALITMTALLVSWSLVASRIASSGARCADARM